MEIEGEKARKNEEIATNPFQSKFLVRDVLLFRTYYVCHGILLVGVLPGTRCNGFHLQLARRVDFEYSINGECYLTASEHQEHQEKMFVRGLIFVGNALNKNEKALSRMSSCL